MIFFSQALLRRWQKLGWKVRRGDLVQVTHFWGQELESTFDAQTLEPKFSLQSQGRDGILAAALPATMRTMEKPEPQLTALKSWSGNLPSYDSEIHDYDIFYLFLTNIHQRQTVNIELLILHSLCLITLFFYVFLAPGYIQKLEITITREHVNTQLHVLYIVVLYKSWGIYSVENLDFPGKSQAKPFAFGFQSERRMIFGTSKTRRLIQTGHNSWGSVFPNSIWPFSGSSLVVQDYFAPYHSHRAIYLCFYFISEECHQLAKPRTGSTMTCATERELTAPLPWKWGHNWQISYMCLPYLHIFTIKTCQLWVVDTSLCLDSTMFQPDQANICAKNSWSFIPSSQMARAELHGPGAEDMGKRSRVIQDVAMNPNWWWDIFQPVMCNDPKCIQICQTSTCCQVVTGWLAPARYWSQEGTWGSWGWNQPIEGFQT